MIFIYSTLIEFLIGYLYLKIKKIYLWDYSNYMLNFMGLICLRFFIAWLLLVFFIFILFYHLL